ncbi:MAG: anaerobic ribonucleoside-triphosphate reductase [Bacilli bacterium]|nr:anaerobic ribonucleoside-triphosphate reductase [Mycoplasmatota bacterium]MDD6941250.1 anaerobic ribonucleoside-triphosphate reductase [bacterium]MDY2697664.1 anaerobic ribonucleoside-triphosphate reductase [Bacilli bacterium]MDY5993032.1 anaerobic ribonucleoside-triphosphate reductase [Bacilli bacterium]MEE0014464.1 anaerobic ribonucleoside-triphosphate reductase [Bacilli bacterium]
MRDIKIIKKNGNLEKFDPDRIRKAVTTSAERVMVDLTDEAVDKIIDIVKNMINTQTTNPTVDQVHSFVESALDQVNPLVARSYREYRDYKKEVVHILDKVYKKAQVITYIGDKECANMDSALVTTQRCLIYNSLNKELYKKFFLTANEIEACKDGYIYIHDMSARRDTMNCCLFDMANVLKDGFEMSNIWYTEPKTLQTAFNVMGDVIINTTAMQYGGFTVPEVDTVLKKYARLTYKKYYDEYLSIKGDSFKDEADKYAWSKVKRECEQGYQGIEYKLNTVSSSRGDYPFVTFTFGIDTDEFAKLISRVILDVHREGQGKKGFKKPTLFPKLVFLYDEKLHGKGMELRDNFLAAIKCSQKTMYPDYLSLSGEGYVCDIYKKYGRVVSPMGCRAFLSPWYEKGGMNPADKNDKPVYIGRFNIGAISLHLPMILAKAREEQRDFYEVLDYYLEMIRKIHIRTYRYLAKRKASTNPLAYCQGGFYGGNLKPDEAIEPVLRSSTASFGITALNELQVLYNGKSIVEDGEFAIEVLKYINKKTLEFKDEDHILYAIYGTPAENLCGLQIKQFRKKYGVIEGVSSREYVSNSFHCGVWEDITGIEKQDLENRFWELFKGGRIQYVRYNLSYNKEAMLTYIERAMKLGFYEGVNLSLAYCNNCGHEELEMDVCPKCGSSDLTKIDRMNGYLSYSRVHGDTMLSNAKMVEISERKSM